MASKRHQRRSSCNRHRAHATMGAAITAAGLLRQKHPGEKFDAWHCRGCGKYHAGHLPGRIARLIEERTL